MTGESTIFAAQFSDMFNKFVKQQLDFQKKVEKTFNQIANNSSNKKNSKQKDNFESILEEFNAKPKNPREVQKDPTPVTIFDLSKKAVEKLKGTTININGKDIEDASLLKNSGFLSKLLGGFGLFSFLKKFFKTIFDTLLYAIKNFIPKFNLPAIARLIGRGFIGMFKRLWPIWLIGIGTQLEKYIGDASKDLLSGLGLAGGIPKLAEKTVKAFKGILTGSKLGSVLSGFKNNKVFQKLTTHFDDIGKILANPAAKVTGAFFKRLPYIGLLLSLGYGGDKILKGDVLSGTLDIASGIAYMFPGLGTALGLGIDALNWMLTSEVTQEDAKNAELLTSQSGIDKSFSEIISQSLAALKVSSQKTVGAKLSLLGEEFDKYKKDRNLNTLIGFLEPMLGSLNPAVMALKYLRGDDLLASEGDAPMQTGLEADLFSMLFGPLEGFMRNLFDKTWKFFSDSIDTVWYSITTGMAEAKRSIVEHEGREAMIKGLEKDLEKLGIDSSRRDFDIENEFSEGGKRYLPNFTQKEQEAYIQYLRGLIPYKSNAQRLKELQLGPNPDLIIPKDATNIHPIDPIPLENKKEENNNGKLLIEQTQNLNTSLNRFSNQTELLLSALAQKSNTIASSTTNNNYFNITSGVKDFRSTV